MNLLLENGDIKQLDCGTNFSYILNDNSMFLVSDYKMLQKQSESNFVKCMKMLYNGRIQLYYSTQSLRPLTSVLNNIDENKFYDIIMNLISQVNKVMQNGFLSCRNVDLSLEHIFVNSDTYNISLTYLPVSKKIYDSDTLVEKELRALLIQLIDENPRFSQGKAKKLLAKLNDSSITFEQICSFLSDESGDESLRNEKKTVRLVSLNAPEEYVITITKDNFVLGRSQQLADGVVPDNRMVGRTHCRINVKEDKYFITDLDSLNGTFVNGIRLPAKSSSEIKDGDMIRMSSSEFKVSIG